jgi:hypothetical protein
MHAMIRVRRWLWIVASVALAGGPAVPLLAFTQRPGATTWYVRTDGGTPAQCTGLADAPYPGSGTNQPCAWDHPFRALPPGGAPVIAGGDTLVIRPGSYRMGYGAPGAESCDAGGSWDCVMPPVPGGPSPANPTRILGGASLSACVSPPQLWGAERANQVLDLSGSSNVQVSCLELTDHLGCVEFHSGGLACQRDNPPYGDWAADGLHAADSANVQLSDLNIHGFADVGVRAGRLRDWTVERVRIAGNGWAGWDGDLNGDDSNAGTLTFRRWTVEWNGCAETWPGGQPAGCWAQEAGGYGDGVGTGATGGHWIIEDSAFLHNTSDGLDLLYATITATIEIRRTHAEGNAGNQIKTTGSALVENSIVVGNCGYFNGQPFSYWVDDCRAYGSAVAFDLRQGDAVTLVNSTLTSEGDCLVGSDCNTGAGACNGTERVNLHNDIFVGQVDFLQPFEQSCLAYQETYPSNPFVFAHAVITDVKNAECPPGNNNQCSVVPGVRNFSVDTFDAHLLAGSPAIDAADATVAPPDDFDGRTRGALPDIGAYEWWLPVRWIYLPVMIRR